jgi:hypothetical protein
MILENIKTTRWTFGTNWRKCAQFTRYECTYWRGNGRTGSVRFMIIYLYYLFISRMLDEIGHRLDRVESKMDLVLKKLAKVTRLNDGLFIFFSFCQLRVVYFLFYRQQPVPCNCRSFIYTALCCDFTHCYVIFIIKNIYNMQLLI